MLRALKRLAPRPGCQPSTVLVLPARGRKTRHDPPAKSKVGRVKMPPAVDPAEFFVLTERYRQYRQTVGALRQEFASEVRREAYEARSGVLVERRVREAAEEHRALMAWNQEENRRLQQLRIARLQLEARDQELRQAEDQAQRAREKQAWVQLKEQEVLQLQEEAKNFITRENLEARIEEALDSRRTTTGPSPEKGRWSGTEHRGS